MGESDRSEEPPGKKRNLAHTPEEEALPAKPDRLLTGSNRKLEASRRRYKDGAEVTMLKYMAKAGMIRESNRYMVGYLHIPKDIADEAGVQMVGCWDGEVIFSTIITNAFRYDQTRHHGSFVLPVVNGTDCKGDDAWWITLAGASDAISLVRSLKNIK